MSNYLYHATYKPLLRSIKKQGLVPGTRKNWDFSNSSVICLATDEYIAESYAETAELIPDSYFDNIIVFKINVDDLDQSKLAKDENVDGGDGEDTFQYSGNIDYKLLTLVEM